MINSKFGRAVLYVYGLLATLGGLGSFAWGLNALPGATKLLVLSWIPLLAAYWLYLWSEHRGKQRVWQPVIVLAIISDLVVSFVVAPQVADVPLTSSNISPGLLFMLPLYIYAVSYAFKPWVDVKKKPATDKRPEKR